MKYSIVLARNEGKFLKNDAPERDLGAIEAACLNTDAAYTILILLGQMQKQIEDEELEKVLNGQEYFKIDKETLKPLDKIDSATKRKVKTNTMLYICRVVAQEGHPLDQFTDIAVQRIVDYNQEFWGFDPEPIKSLALWAAQVEMDDVNNVEAIVAGDIVYINLNI